MISPLRGRTSRTPRRFVPLGAASAFATAAAAFGYSRDFGWYLASLIALPISAFALLCVIGGAYLIGGDAVEHRLAVVVALAAPVAYVTAAPLGDRVAFSVWAIAHHRELGRAMRHDGIVETWNSWGLAGLENDSYLVIDEADALDSPGGASRWRARLALPCDIVRAERLWPDVYLAVTSNCSFDERPEPSR